MLCFNYYSSLTEIKRKIGKPQIMKVNQTSKSFAKSIMTFQARGFVHLTAVSRSMWRDRIRQFTYHLFKFKWSENGKKHALETDQTLFGVY